MNPLGGSGADKRIGLEVLGIPATQGSKVYKGQRTSKATGRTFGVLVDSSDKLKPWRTAVQLACLAQPFRVEDVRVPVFVEVEFRFVRPRTSKLAHPGRQQGDIDKLLRSTYDGLVMGGIIADDSQIQSGEQRKRWCLADEMSGATIIIETY